MIIFVVAARSDVGSAGAAAGARERKSINYPPVRLQTRREISHRSITIIAIAVAYQSRKVGRPPAAIVTLYYYYCSGATAARERTAKNGVTPHRR